ncbi:MULTISPECIES: hypothetical protein [Clostridium]|uniref:hypothetical protein n=1 Tax=Clostridium TaxID=1485 RepID=UPI00117780B8|nr:MULTISPECIES: hypothetical protein [Clostridium]MDB2121207.1 hypothetical protein [Clostridium paraputrificum]
MIKLTTILKNDDKFKFNNDKLNLLVKILSLYNNQIIDIDVIKDNLNLSYDTANELLLLLARNEVVKINYKVWCDNPNNNSDKTIYENIYDVPMDECDMCDKKCKKLSNIYIVYRVIVNE